MFSMFLVWLLSRLREIKEQKNLGSYLFYLLVFQESKKPTSTEINDCIRIWSTVSFSFFPIFLSNQMEALN